MSSCPSCQRRFSLSNSYKEAELSEKFQDFMIQQLVSKLFWVPLRFPGQMGNMFYSIESCSGITKCETDTIWVLSLFKRQSDLVASKQQQGQCSRKEKNKERKENKKTKSQENPNYKSNFRARNHYLFNLQNLTSAF